MLIKKHDFILWLLVALSATLSTIGGMPFAVEIAGKLSIIAISSRLLFALIHGSQRLGWHRLGIMFGIACIVSL